MWQEKVYSCGIWGCAGGGYEYSCLLGSDGGSSGTYVVILHSVTSQKTASLYAIKYKYFEILRFGLLYGSKQ